MSQNQAPTDKHISHRQKKPLSLAGQLSGMAPTEVVAAGPEPTEKSPPAAETTNVEEPLARPPGLEGPGACEIAWHLKRRPANIDPDILPSQSGPRVGANQARKSGQHPEALLDLSLIHI